MEIQKNSIPKSLLLGLVVVLSAIAIESSFADPLATPEVLSVSPRMVDADEFDIYDQVATGLNVVGVGTKVYLQANPEDAGLVSDYEWTITRYPFGSISLPTPPTGELITFRPDVEGEYEITLTPLDLGANPTTTTAIDIYAGTYIGAGVFNTHEEPDDSIPHCGNTCCHAENEDFSLNVLDEWVQSGHATKLQRHLAGEFGSYYPAYCNNCHALGFDQNPLTVNNGFDDIADDIGYDLANISALVADAVTSGNDNWPLLPPELQSHASIQCESCHGPGSLHLGAIQKDGHGIAGANLDIKQCATCHDSASGHQQGFYQWSGTAHAVADEDSHASSCTKCHTGEGFIAITVNQEENPDLPDHGASGITCAACHDPHYSDHPHQLRITGDVDFDSGETFEGAGIGGLCISCHQSRVSDAMNTALTSRRGAHHGPQGDILRGINALDFGFEVIGNSAHSTIVEDSCVTCHMAEGVGDGLTPPLVGEHTYSMRDVQDPNDPNDDILNAENACSSCHGPVDDYDLPSRGDYDGDGVTEGTQSEVAGIFDLMRPTMLTWPGASLDSHGKIGFGQSDFDNLTDAQKFALYNYNIIWEDGSMGVHNTSYAVQALHRAYEGVFGHPITDDYPDIDLRGPVAPILPPDPDPDPLPPDEEDEYLAHVEILSVSPRMVETDETGVYDVPSTGLKAVGLGTKTYLEAVPVDPELIDSYTWAVKYAPAGSVAELSDTSGTLVTFRPDVEGRYTIELTSNSTTREASPVFEQDIIAAVYKGAGTFNTHETPDPKLGQCGTTYCHGENAAIESLMVVDEWLESHHSTKLQRHLAGELGAYYPARCNTCHAVGFNEDPEAVNDGFDDVAAEIGFDIDQIQVLVADAATSGIDNFPALPAELQNLASIQCESCHGPGSQHPVNLGMPDAGIDGANLSQKQCAQCHDSASGYQQGFYQWNASSHPISQDAAGGHASETASCLKCHTAEGFVDVRVKGVGPTVSPDAHGITCAACHDPHHSGEENELRVTGDFTLDSADRSFGAGHGGLCINCHNARVSDADETALNSFRGAHHGTQGDMFLGVNASGLGLAFETNSAHTSVVPDSCVYCHMAEPTESGGGVTEPPLVGSHTFALRDTKGTPEEDDDVTNVENACSTCHQGLDTLDFPASGDYDGNGTIEGVQTEVAGLFDLLKPGILSSMPGTSEGSDGTIDIGGGDFANLTDDQKRALYNFNFVVEDGSRGIHNTSYAVQILQRSYYNVYGRPINQDYPDVDLRGPVQDMVEFNKHGILLK